VFDVNSINLTIEGIETNTELSQTGSGDIFTLGANATNNNLTLRNIKLNGDVLVFNLANFSLAGSASLNTITLTASAAQNSIIAIATGWNGSINSLHLRGLKAELAGTNGVIENWEGWTVLRGAGLTPAVITQLNNVLGDFIDDPGNKQVINHLIVLEGGEGILRENLTPITSVALTVTAPVTDAIPETSASGTGDFTVGTVTWAPDHNPFQAGTQYTVNITLKANTNYTFTNGFTGTVTINGCIATVSNNIGTSVRLSYQFPETAGGDLPSELEAVAAYLASSPNGDNPDNPVNLDLSAATMNEQNVSADPALNPVFNPVWDVPAGKDKIVELTLPTAATSTFPTLALQPAFNHFTALTEVSGVNVITIGSNAFRDRFNLV
jgi:hypothetical protein